MDLKKNRTSLGRGAAVLMALILASLIACVPKYSLSGASIDYSKTKTIEIAEFPVRSSYVWGTMANMFNNQLKDHFANRTRLVQVRRNGDLKLAGEITQYSQRNKSISSEGYSTQAELSMSVNVRFTNGVNQNENFEKQFTATATYDSSQPLTAVQEELVTQMVKDLCDQIYNATVANW